MVRTIKAVLFAVLVAISGVGLYGCASTGGGREFERPEALTGQSSSNVSRTTESSRGPRYEWSGKGLQYGRVVRD